MSSSFFAKTQTQVLLVTADQLCRFYQPTGVTLNTRPVGQADQFIDLAKIFYQDLDPASSTTLDRERYDRLGLLINGMSEMQGEGRLEQWHVNSFLATLGSAAPDSHAGRNTDAVLTYIQLVNSIQDLVFFPMYPPCSNADSKNADRFAAQAVLGLKKSLLFFLERDNLGTKAEEAISKYCTTAEGEWGLDNHDTAEFIGEMRNKGFFPVPGETMIEFLSRLLTKTGSFLHVVLPNKDQIMADHTGNPEKRYHVSVRYHEGPLTGKVVSCQPSRQDIPSYVMRHILIRYVNQVFAGFQNPRFKDTLLNEEFYRVLVREVFTMVLEIQKSILANPNPNPDEDIEIVQKAWQEFQNNFRATLTIFLNPPVEISLRTEILSTYNDAVERQPRLPDDFAFLLTKILS